jgi:leucyl aminopeptidase (aminopeptidase T)
MRNVELYVSAMVTVRDCLALRAGERLVVVTDTMQPLSVGEALFAAARVLGAEPSLMIISPRRSRAEGIPPPVAEAMKQADAMVLYTSPPISWSQAVRDAQNQGTRLATLLLSDWNKPETVQPNLIEASFVRGVHEETLQIAELTRKISEMVERAKSAQITSPGGTHLTMQLGNKVSVLDGLATEPGQYGQLPAGTFAVAPKPKSANGIVVVDVSIPPLGILQEPITIEVRESMITSIKGGAEADRLQNHLESFKDPTVYNCPAEWGFGTNPNVIVSGNFLEEERILGWAHIAIGDDMRFDGGTVKSPVHLDGMLRDTSLELDGQPVIDRGKILI